MHHQAVNEMGHLLAPLQLFNSSLFLVSQVDIQRRRPFLEVSHLLGTVGSTSTPSTSSGAEVARAKQAGSVRFHIKGTLGPHRADGQIVL